MKFEFEASARGRFNLGLSPSKKIVSLRSSRTQISSAASLTAGNKKGHWPSRANTLLIDSAIANSSEISPPFA
ncbi:hypothetical protein RB5012 [Rhodopirellula baltica SH 1]|uniref:Uncharacterized protein n=1 Tax=Rhodopirellula baltica (strain DSM 10527 / NCIMB 13988 / SH1) TaxID=243090 RepID=Q7UGU1_RHOBA|nr:hypothetical protein RB5012 [Rhodopirellula baltica SH 1]